MEKYAWFQLQAEWGELMFSIYNTRIQGVLKKKKNIMYAPLSQTQKHAYAHTLTGTRTLFQIKLSVMYRPVYVVRIYIE